MPAPSWLILADDLTGAADCGIAFARRGLAASVGWGPVAPAAEVLALDLDSRRLPPGQAAARHRAALQDHAGPATRVVKKLDSTLRGQPAAELAALLALRREQGRPALALVAPAFPATGRTTRAGHVLLHGAPLEQSALWQRDHSYASADLAQVLASAGLRSARLTAPPDRAPLRAAMAEGLDALVCDAESEADLLALARASLPLAERVLWCGSGGIAAALAEAALPAEAAAPARPLRRKGGILVLVGSIAEASRAAAARALALGALRHFPLDAAALLAGCAEVAAIAATLAAGADALVTLEAEGQADLSQGAKLAARLADLLAPAAPHLSALFATGGETACALLSHLGVTGIRLVAEAEPGVPLGVTQGALAFPVMTKAGAFGTEDTIARSLHRLRDLPREDMP